MSIDTLKARLPDYAKDLRLNLSSLAAEAHADEATARQYVPGRGPYPGRGARRRRDARR
jgi:hypothetical protein